MKIGITTETVRDIFLDLDRTEVRVRIEGQLGMYFDHSHYELAHLSTAKTREMIANEIARKVAHYLTDEVLARLNGPANYGDKF